MSEPTAKITLAGRDFPVAKLSVRQLRLVVPALSELLNDIGPMMGSVMMALENPDNPRAAVTALTSFQLTEKHFDAFIRALLPTLRKLTPGLQDDEILDMEIGVFDLLGTLPVIMEMTGLLKQKPAKPTTEAPGEPPPGEAMPPAA